MKEYAIYNMNTDEKIGTVKANSVDEAEWKASALFNYHSNEMYALTAN